MSSSAELRPAGTVLRAAGEDLAVPFRLGPVADEAAGPGSSRASARAEGYSTGWAQGIREARTATAAARERAVEDLARMVRERADRASGALLALRAAADQVHATTVQRAEDILDAVVVAAVELAEAMAGAAVATDLVSAARLAIGRALAELPANVPVVVRLHPEDHAELLAAGAGDPAPDTAPDGRVTLRPDPAVERGGAVAETAVATVDATLSAAVRRVRAELGR